MRLDFSGFRCFDKKGFLGLDCQMLNPALKSWAGSMFQIRRHQGNHQPCDFVLGCAVSWSLLATLPFDTCSIKGVAVVVMYILPMKQEIHRSMLGKLHERPH